MSVNDDPAQRRVAEQAVVKAALHRAWLTGEVVAAAREAAEKTGQPLLVALGAHLDAERRQALAEVHRQALSRDAQTVADQGSAAGSAAWSGVAATAAGSATTPGLAAAWGPRDSGAPPKRIGPYDVERELARGGMGAVYIARHVELDRRVALKLMLPGMNDNAGDRFEREARVLAKLRHPGIVILHEAGDEGGRRWMALELVSGGSLQGRLDKEGPLDPRVAVELMEQVARAIAFAHAEGLLHRDLKPANVLVDEAGRPKVTDFGIARAVGAQSRQLTLTGVAVGTPQFAPPEQCGGEVEVDVRADVYSLGATLYALLTNRPPFDGAFFEVITKVLREDADRPSSHNAAVPPELDRVVRRCLEKVPAARYPTAEALADELARWLRGESLDTKALTLGQRLRRLRRRRPLAAALLMAVAPLLVLGGVAGWTLVRRPQHDPVAVAGPAPLEVVWLSPAVGAETNKTMVEVGVVVRGEAPWVDVWVEGGDVGEGVATPRRLRGQDEQTLVVKLRPGDNDLTLRWRASTGEEGPPGGSRRVRSSPTPSWFNGLVEAERPPVPLPEGVVFTSTRNVYRNVVDGSELVWIPAGTFIQNKPPEGIVDPSQITSPNRRVSVARQTTLTRGYFVGRTEVRWGQFDAFCEATGRPLRSREILFRVQEGEMFDLKGVRLEKPFVAGDDHPVYRVVWDDAVAYCAWAGLRLPTDAEWERAARGVNGQEQPWGDGPPVKGDCNCLDQDDGSPITSPVASHPRDLTPSGCYDMAGNLCEWVSDRFGELDATPVTDPPGPAEGAERVLRGTTFIVAAGGVRLGQRAKRPPTWVDDTIGFRVAR